VRRATEPAAFLLVCALGLLLGGCGGDGGVASGATVSVYVSAPLCAGAKQELARNGGRAGSVRVRAICLPSARRRDRLSLATLGVNARHATADSTSVAYLELPDSRTARFTQPILESAELGWIEARSGSSAMSRLLRAVQNADSASLREALWESLDGS
jgi:hypothetical protein